MAPKAMPWVSIIEMAGGFRPSSRRWTWRYQGSTREAINMTTRAATTPIHSGCPKVITVFSVINPIAIETQNPVVRNRMSCLSSGESSAMCEGIISRRDALYSAT